MLAYQLVYLPSSAFGLGVADGSQTAAEKGDSSPVPTYFEVRSVFSAPVHQPVVEGVGRTVTYGLRYADVDRIMATVPSLNKAVLIRELPKQVRHLEKVFDVRVVGTTQEFSEFNELEMERGRFITAADDANRRDCAVLGSKAAKTLFPTQDPVGQSVSIGSDSFTIVGVAKHLSASGPKPREADNHVYIPLNTSKFRYGDWIASSRGGQSQMLQLSRIIFQGLGSVKAEETAKLINSALKPFHPRGGVEVVIVKPDGGK